MSLGSKLNQLSSDETERQKLVERAADAQSLKIAKLRTDEVEAILNKIKENIKLIVEGKIAPEYSRSKKIRITDMIEIYGHNGEIYGDLQSRNTIDLCELLLKYANKLDRLKEKPVNRIISAQIHVLIRDFDVWLLNNEIKGIDVHFEHDGIGMRSWNSYWVRN